MLKNYLKIAFRNLRKHKGYSFINVTGLAVGIACCLLILLFVQDELSYDRFHKNADKIYRVTEEVNWSGGYENVASIPYSVATALANDFPQIENTCRLYRQNRSVSLRYGDKQFTEEKFFFADPAIFEVFSFTLSEGNPQTALQGATGVVISEAIAQKYFGDENPIGKILEYQNNQTLTVTGVLNPIPENSHLKFDFLAPFEFNAGVRQFEQNWYWTAFWTYLVLPDAQTAENLENQLPNFVEKYFPESIREGTMLSLQKLTDIHLYSQLNNEVEANGNIIYIYVFSAIALLVLLIACINFMNLATARSAKRAKEVGLRKVLGAYRSNLIKQFLGEAMLMSVFAVVLGLGIVELCLPVFNGLVDKSLATNYLDNWPILGGIFAIAIFVGIIAGSYPAFFLSGFRPVNVLKGKPASTGATSRSSLRKILVVAQFIVSIVLLIGVGIIAEQLEFFRNKELGFDKDQVVYIRSRPDVNLQFDAFEDEMLKAPGALQVTRAIGSFPGEPTWTYRVVPEGTPREKPKAMPIIYVDFDFAEVLGLEILQGRDFSEDFPGDRMRAFVINETAAKELGWEGDAVGRKMEYFGAGSDEIEKSGEVIGVVKDFHFESLHQKVQPLLMTVTWRRMGHVAARISPENIPATLAAFEKTWHQFAPQWPFEFAFLDKNLENFYRKEAKLNQMIQYFTFLAIFIACLGLFGLASFTAEQRTKEIGVRKVLGASLGNVIVLLTKQFIWLVLIANLIAWPLAYWVMNNWLQNFAYRVDIGWQTFALAGVAALLITILTVSYQAIKAALTNPVEALRYE